MYFLRGSLPWQGLKAATNKQKYEKIGEKKQTTPIEELCQGFPEEFAKYLTYVRKLGFEETPEYDQLRLLFDRVLKSINEVDDGRYDWMILKESKGLDTTAVSRTNHGDSATRHATLGTASKAPHHSSSMVMGVSNLSTKHTDAVGTPRPSLQRGPSATNASLSPRPLNSLPPITTAQPPPPTMALPPQKIHHENIESPSTKRRSPWQSFIDVLTCRSC